MAKPAQPELKRYMDRRLYVNVQAGRKVSGTLRGYDIFLNLVLDDAKDETRPGEVVDLGGTIVIRGNSVSSIETLEPAKY